MLTARASLSQWRTPCFARRERPAKKIVADLVADGYITRTRDGRRNRYTINREAQLRHPLFSDLPIGPLVDALIDGNKPGPAR